MSSNEIVWNTWSGKSRTCSSPGCRKTGVTARITTLYADTPDEKRRHHVFCEEHTPVLESVDG